MPNGSLGFWTGGPEALREGLKQDYDTTVGELQKRLKDAASEEERRRVADELRQVEKTYEEQLGRVDKDIF